LREGQTGLCFVRAGYMNAGPPAEFYRHMRVVGYGAFAIG
jgi:hypothetical protein